MVENFNMFDFELSADDMEKIATLDKEQSALQQLWQKRLDVV